MFSQKFKGRKVIRYHKKMVLQLDKSLIPLPYMHGEVPQHSLSRVRKLEDKMEYSSTKKDPLNLSENTDKNEADEKEEYSNQVQLRNSLETVDKTDVGKKFNVPIQDFIAVRAVPFLPSKMFSQKYRGRKVIRYHKKMVLQIDKSLIPLPYMHGEVPQHSLSPVRKLEDKMEYSSVKVNHINLSENTDYSGAEEAEYNNPEELRNSLETVDETDHGNKLEIRDSYLLPSTPLQELSLLPVLKENNLGGKTKDEYNGNQKMENLVTIRGYNKTCPFCQNCLRSSAPRRYSL